MRLAKKKYAVLYWLPMNCGMLILFGKDRDCLSFRSARDAFGMDLAAPRDHIFAERPKTKKKDPPLYQRGPIETTGNLLAGYVSQRGIRDVENAGVANQEQVTAYSSVLDAAIKEIRSSISYRMGCCGRSCPEELKLFYSKIILAVEQSRKTRTCTFHDDSIVVTK